MELAECLAGARVEYTGSETEKWIGMIGTIIAANSYSNVRVRFDSYPSSHTDGTCGVYCHNLSLLNKSQQKPNVWRDLL